MRLRLLAAIGCLLLIVAACGNDDTETEDITPDDDPTEDATTDETDDATVAVTMAFEPATLEVDVGTTVTWESESDLPHTVTSTSGPTDFDESLSSGDTVTITFDEPGTYEYECTIHPGMTGTVVVS